MDSWKIRRKLMYGTLFFCFACVVFVLAKGMESKVAETVVMSAFGAIMVVLTSYVFGAAWEDINDKRNS